MRKPSDLYEILTLFLGRLKWSVPVLKAIPIAAAIKPFKKANNSLSLSFFREEYYKTNRYIESYLAM